MLFMAQKAFSWILNTIIESNHWYHGRSSYKTDAQFLFTILGHVSKDLANESWVLLLAASWCHMVTWSWVNIGSGNGLFPDGKLLRSLIYKVNPGAAAQEILMAVSL